MNPKSNTESAENPIDAALNVAGFAEFLARHDDAEDIATDEEKIEKTLEIFERKKSVIDSIRKIVKEKITQEVGVSGELVVSNDDLEDINKHVEGIAVEDQKAFMKMSEALEEFDTTTTEIKALEDRIKTLGGNLYGGIEKDSIGSTKDSVADKLTALTNAKDSSGNYERATMFVESLFSSKAKTVREEVLLNRGQVQEKYGFKYNALSNTFDHLDEHIEAVESLVKLQELRSGILKQYLPAEALNKVVQQKVKVSLDELSSSDKLNDLYKAQDILERARKATDEGDGLDYVEGLNETEQQKKLDDAFDQKVVEMVGEAVTKTDLGSKALTRLEKSLKEFTERESLGSKDKDDLNQLITQTLENQIGSLPSSTEEEKRQSKAKSLLIKRIIIKINSK